VTGRNQAFATAHWMAGSFVLIALPLLVFLAIWMPANEAPDEWSGIVRADSIRHGEIIAERLPVTDSLGHPATQAGISADWALLTAAFVFPNTGFPNKILTPELLAHQRAVPWQNHLSSMQVNNTAPYMPLFYAPGAIGLGLGKALGLGPYDSIRMGRLITALTYVLLCTAALLLARRGHGVLFATATLPMSLSLGASFNQDGMLIATSVLAASLLTRCLSGWSYWLAGLLLSAVLAAKPPYVPMAGLMLATALLWGNGSGSSWRRGLVATALTAIPTLIWVAIIKTYVISDFLVSPPYLPGPLWPGDPTRLFAANDQAAQMQVLLHDPTLMVRLPLLAMQEGFTELMREMIGVLVQLDLRLPDWAYRLWFVTLPLVLVTEMFSHPGPERSAVSRSRATLARLAGLACLVGALFAVYLGQYLSWTRVGITTLGGVQGRYLLPILPFLPLAMPDFPPLPRWRDFVALPGIGRSAVVLAAGAGLVMFPTLVFATYYRH
jgi:hypothetical protein